MSRFTNRRSYGQKIRRLDRDHFRLVWVVDFYYPDSNLRHPRQFTRDTDETGAQRFSKKWRVDVPASPTP